MLETVGAHWLHPSRNLYGRRSCTVEVVQYLSPLPGYDRLAVQGRLIDMLKKSDVDIWLRVDYSSTASQPPLNDVDKLFHFNLWLQGLANDPNYGSVRGFIIGNEPNLTGTPAWWVARCVYGYGAEPSDTNNAYQFVTTINPKILVLAPPVAPWSAAADGDFGQFYGDPILPAPPDKRLSLMPWERYQGALAWRCYTNGGHAPYDKIKFAMHIYSNMQAAFGSVHEPTMDLRDPSWQNAHNGSRVFEDMHYQLVWASGGNPPPVMISEWNTFINGQWPCENYQARLMVNLIRQYLRFKPNLMGFASFVDTNYAGDSPYWLKSAITGYLDTSGALTDAEKSRLRAWDADFSTLLSGGW